MASGISSDFLRASGLSWQTVKRWIDGERVPDLHQLEQVGEALNVDPRELLGEAEGQSWERVPKHLLVALAQVDPAHYTIVMNFLESFTLERERSRVVEVSERLKDPGRGRNKRPK